jgi:hypothetical protein
VSSGKLDRLLIDERGHDSAGARRKRLRINEIGAEIREIDRMMNALRVRLLWIRPEASIR